MDIKDNASFHWKKSVDAALKYCGDRRIALMGSDLLTQEIFRTLLADKNRKVSFVVTDRPELFSVPEGQSIRVLYTGDFVDSKIMPEDSFVLVAQTLRHKEAYELLIANHFLLLKDFLIFGIGGITLLLDRIDSLLTLNRQYEKDLLGFRTITNVCNGEESCKIVILGNSTSDPSTGALKCWGEFLLDEFSKWGVKVIIYNGAITGYSSTQEFLKLNRDVLTLKPDIVISFSGYNDVADYSTVLHFPYLHKYGNKFYNFLQQQPRLAPDSLAVRDVKQVSHGLQNEEEDYEIWLNNMRKMNAICELFHIKFYAFLQPMLDDADSIVSEIPRKIIDELLELCGSDSVDEKVIHFCDNVRTNVGKYPFITDLTHIFKGEYDVFYDTCHYTEKGNKMIAKQVFRRIWDM